MLRGLFPLTIRLLVNVLRAPWFVAFALVQPLIWLTLFGSLFSSFSGSFLFEGESYITYLAPGLAVMSAVFGSAYSGIQALSEINNGIVEKFRTTPASLAAITLAPILQSAIVTAMQAAMVVAIALCMGAKSDALWTAVPGIAAVGLLVGLVFSGLSNVIALSTRQIPAVMGIINFLTLPLTFTSSMLMSPPGMPAWMRSAAEFNPINWAVVLGRACFTGRFEAATVLRNVGLLAGLAVLLSLAAINAMRRYQRSL